MVDTVPASNGITMGSMASQLWVSQTIENAPSTNSTAASAEITPSVQEEIPSEAPKSPRQPVSPVERTSSGHTDSEASTPFVELSVPVPHSVPHHSETPTKELINVSVHSDTPIRASSPVPQPPRNVLSDTVSSAQSTPPTSATAPQPVLSPASLLSAAMGESNPSDISTPILKSPQTPTDSVHTISRNNTVVSTPMTPKSATKSDLNRQVNTKINYSKQFTV